MFADSSPYGYKEDLGGVWQRKERAVGRLYVPALCQKFNFIYTRFLSPTTYSVLSCFIFLFYTRFSTISIEFQQKKSIKILSVGIIYYSLNSKNLNFVLIGIYCFYFIKFFRFLPHRPKCHIRVGYLHFKQHKYNLLQILYIHKNNNTHNWHHRGNIKTRIRMGKYPRFHPSKNYPCTNI